MVIIRHAKSSWEEEEKNDFDRALKPKGINDIVRIAGETKTLLGEIDVVFSSSANRAVHTAILFAKAVGIPTEKISIVDDLYETNEVIVLNFVRALDNNLGTVAIIGHNPTLTDFANLFVDEQIDNIPTSGLVRIDFREDCWENISKKNVNKVTVRFP